jgi:hypothetical protein
MKLMFDTIISCHEYKEKESEKMVCWSHIYKCDNNNNVNYGRYHVPFIRTSLPNGGVTFIFSHSPMDRISTKVAAMGSLVTVLYIMEFVILTARMG